MALKALGAFPTLDGIWLLEINGRHVAKKCYSRVLTLRTSYAAPASNLDCCQTLQSLRGLSPSRPPTWLGSFWLPRPRHSVRLGVFGSIQHVHHWPGGCQIGSLSSDGLAFWARVGLSGSKHRSKKRPQRKGHSCEALRLQAQSLANGPVLEGIRP